MGKGRYLKAAERACSRKSRFETRAAAESFVQGRYRAYRCVVCGAYHLTSGQGDRPEPPEPKRKEPPGPKLGDLDWSAILGPPKTVAKSGEGQSVSPSAFVETTTKVPNARQKKVAASTARCVASCTRDGRVLLVFEGRLVKSRPVERSLRPRLKADVEVEVEGVPLTVVVVRD